MDISCPECQRRFLVPEEKLPANTRVMLTCPGCKGKIPVDTTGQSKEIGSLSGADQEGAIEFFEEGTKKGLVCVPDDPVKEDVVRMLGELDYKTSTADDLRTFYAKVRYNHYDIIVVSEGYGGGEIENNPILKYLERLSMSIRRNICLVLISAQHRTLDTLAAYSLSVDTVINESDLSSMREVLNKSLVRNEQFYKVFKECLTAEGRA